MFVIDSEYQAGRPVVDFYRVRLLHSPQTLRIVDVPEEEPHVEREHNMGAFYDTCLKTAEGRLVAVPIVDGSWVPWESVAYVYPPGVPT